MTTGGAAGAAGAVGSAYSLRRGIGGALLLLLALLLAVVPVWMFVGSLGGGVAWAEGALLWAILGAECLSVVLGLTVLVLWVVTQLLVRAAVGKYAAARG